MSEDSEWSSSESESSPTGAGSHGVPSPTLLIGTTILLPINSTIVNHGGARLSTALKASTEYIIVLATLNSPEMTLGNIQYEIGSCCRRFTTWRFLSILESLNNTAE